MYGEEYQELGRPNRFQQQRIVGRPIQSKKRTVKDLLGVGYINITLRSGEPATRGRGVQENAACKGNICRTGRTGETYANLTARNSNEGNEKQRAQISKLISVTKRRSHAILLEAYQQEISHRS